MPARLGVDPGEVLIWLHLLVGGENTGIPSIDVGVVIVADHVSQLNWELDQEATTAPPPGDVNHININARNALSKWGYANR
jgi:hypothetical protein